MLYEVITPWPGIYLDSGLKLKRMGLESRDGEYTPGAILAVADDAVVVGCRRGALRIHEVQPPSKTEMAAIDYLNGKRLGVADLLA